MSEKRTYPADLLEEDRRLEKLAAEAKQQQEQARQPRRLFDVALAGSKDPKGLKRLKGLKELMWEVDDFNDKPKTDPAVIEQIPALAGEVAGVLIEAYKRLLAFDAEADLRNMSEPDCESIFEALWRSVSEDQDRARQGFKRVIPLLHSAMNEDRTEVEKTIKDGLSLQRWSAFTWIEPVISYLADRHEREKRKKEDDESKENDRRKQAEAHQQAEAESQSQTIVYAPGEKRMGGVVQGAVGTLNRVESACVEVLRKQSPLTGELIANKAGYSTRYVRTPLAALVQRGVLKKVKGGYEIV